MRNIVEDAQFLSERTEMLHFFQEKFYNPDETEITHSPSGKFKLEIRHYNHEEGIRRYRFDSSMKRYKTLLPLNNGGKINRANKKSISCVG